MGTNKLYRWDYRALSPGDIIASSGDHIERLESQPEQKKTEELLRQQLPNGNFVRSTSLYGWQAPQCAKEFVSLGYQSQGRRLYELEFDDDDFVMGGDLHWFTAAADAAGDERVKAVQSYINNDDHNEKKYIEVLVKKATVIGEIDVPRKAIEKEKFDFGFATGKDGSLTYEE